MDPLKIFMAKLGNTVTLDVYQGDRESQLSVHNERDHSFGHEILK